MKRFTLLLCLVVLAATRCGVPGSIENASTKIANTLDDAIAQLGSSTANIQQVMDQTLSNLPSDVQATIRSDISNAFQRGISAASAEVRCDIDFIRDRVRQSLQRIKARIIGNALPAPDPVLCNTVPTAIDMGLKPEQRNKIEFFGYDLDLANLKVLLFNGSVSSDVTAFLSKTTHYHMVLNLGGNGIQLGEQSAKLVLRYKDQDLSTIQMIQKIPQVCETKIHNFTPNMVSFIPPHTSGDKEFKAHGPNVSCSVELINLHNRIDARIFMQARETQKDYSEVRGDKTVTIYTPDPGYEVSQIITPAAATFSYTDNDTTDDTFGGSGPVNQFTFVGDGQGDDAGIQTRVDVYFSSIRIQLKENRDCVDDVSLRALVQQNALSESTLNKIKKSAPRMLQAPPAEQ